MPDDSMAPKGKTRTEVPPQRSVTTIATSALNTTANPVADEITEMARWFHALTPEQFQRIVERRYRWLAGRWGVWGVLATTALYATIGAVWALTGQTVAIATTAVLVVAALGCCLHLVPTLARASWEAEQLKAHVYSSPEPYISWFFSGFGLGSIPGTLAAVLAYFMLR